jgi:hypothetical protein
MVPALFHNGKVCNDPGSVSQWENFQWVPALFHLQCSSWLCFTIGKFTMLLLALFHNEKIIRIKYILVSLGIFALSVLFLSLCFVNSTFNLSEIWTTLFP